MEDLYDELSIEMNELLIKEDYQGVVEFLDKIKDINLREDLCGLALSLEGIKRAVNEYGEVRVTGDREEYENAKMGLGECSPYNILFCENPDENANVEGIEAFFDFIPEDNPLKQYYQRFE